MPLTLNKPRNSSKKSRPTSGTASGVKHPVRLIPTARDWHDSLGRVPLDRILFDPIPGTATEADLIRMVDGDDKRLVELVNGTLVEKAMGKYQAQLGVEISGRLREIVRPAKLGWLYGADCPIRMAARNVRLPDVTFVARTASDQKRRNENVSSEWPTIAIEIWSESNTKRELAIKRREYFASGTKQVWEFDWRKRSCDVYTDADSPPKRLTGDDVLTAPDILPGFELKLSEFYSILDDVEP
jgi:Uma2 family endonuclease